MQHRNREVVVMYQVKARHRNREVAVMCQGKVQHQNREVVVMYPGKAPSKASQPVDEAGGKRGLTFACLQFSA